MRRPARGLLLCALMGCAALQVACGQTTGSPAMDSGGSGGSSPALIADCDLEDPVLQRAVRAALENESSSQPLANLKALAANGISSLAGIECLVNLEELVSTDGTLSDVSPLSSLSRLQHVQLARNRIRDLSPLSANLELRQLKAASNGLESLQGLTLPPPHACSELVLDFNPLDADDVTFACDAGWPVTWAGNTLQDRLSCNAPCLL